MLSKKIGYWAGVIVFGTIVGFALQFAKAWTEPTAPAPGGNVEAPINISPISQTKIGGIGTDSFLYASKFIVAGTGVPLYAGDIAGTRLCIGSDCRDKWPDCSCGTSTTNPTCTSWTYGPWGACLSNGITTRSWITGSPSGCVGGNPIVSKNCTKKYICPGIYSYSYSSVNSNTYPFDYSALIAGCANWNANPVIHIYSSEQNCRDIMYNLYGPYQSECVSQRDSTESTCTVYALEMCLSTDPTSCGPWKSVSHREESCVLNTVDPVVD